MQDSKIIELLKELDSRMLTRFKEYTLSPYFNKHEATTKLCLYLLKHAPDFTQPEKLSKDRIYKRIFPKEVFDNKKFHRLTSQLLLLLHNFLIDDALQLKENKRMVILLEELRQYKLEKHYRSTEKKYKLKLAKEHLNHHSYYESQYKFYKELDYLFVEQGGRSYNENLQLANDSLDNLFILEKLKMACDMASRNKVIQAHYQWSIMKGIEEHLQDESKEFDSIIQIYHTIFRMLTEAPETTEKQYRMLLELLKKYASQFTKEEILGTYGYALNYAIVKINQQGSTYLEETLEIYLYLVESEAIFVGGFLMPQEYKNIVTLAVRLKKYTWAEQFIEEYKAKLPVDVQNNIYKYNLASLQHSQGDHNKALETLHNVDFINPTYYLGTKIIQLKIYYEREEGEAFYALIDACQSYLRRSKQVADYQKKSTANLMKFSKKLFKIKEEIGYTKRHIIQEAVEKLEQEIEVCNSVANRDWLTTNLSRLAF